MKLRYSLTIAILFLLSSCKKEWLDAKPDKSLVVPSTIEDYQAILDNSTTDPAYYNDKQSLADEIGAGDFIITDGNYIGQQQFDKALYTWKPDLYGGQQSNIEWDIPYRRIYFSNIVLEGISKIQPASASEQLRWRQVKGSASFFRAYNHFNLAQLFCKPYDKSTSVSDLGIPLKDQSDVSLPTTRASVKQTYEFIVADLRMASSLLPVSTPLSVIYKMRPNKAAALAMLARVYLSMEEYDSAYVYSDSCLRLYNTLLDLKTLANPTASNAPIAYSSSVTGVEVLFFMRGSQWFMLTSGVLIRNPELYSQYQSNDLRAKFFFKAPPNSRLGFYGSYTGAANFLFTGLATDEIYLIRAECYARKGDKNGALSDLNALLSKRYDATFVPVTANNSNEALARIIQERRKELCFRGLRWSDLRRLNKDPQFAVTLTRVVNGQTYTLAPNSPLYVLSIPPEVIRFSGIAQNPR